jgi:exo-beta-1,3-glucanase (GH17 family)
LLDFGSKATSLTFNVTNIGEGTLDWVVTDDQDWITVSPTSGSTTSEVDVITVTVDRIVLASGSYSGMVNITSNAGNQDISISMAVMELPPVKGLCYGPFRDGQAPHWGPYPSENEIREAMSILKSIRTKSIRTYGVSNGLDKIIPLANEFDLNVSAGAWLGSNLTSNEEELNTLTDLTQNHDVETVIVGNEVVLSYECGWDTLTKAELIEYTTRVKENVSVPVSTGEPWHIWNDDANSDLVNAVDYILIHVHPYWEGIPINKASGYVIDRCKEIQNKYPHKEVVIGEAGWPSDGSPNGEAVPSLENQKRFMEELLDLADDEGIRLYYFEAFDEKWKEESDVGPHWGLYYSNRTCKHPPKGDLNSDGILTPTDATIALEIAVGSRPCDATMLAAADMSRDGRVTSLDALMILQAAAER